MAYNALTWLGREPVEGSAVLRVALVEDTDRDARVTLSCIERWSAEEGVDTPTVTRFPTGEDFLEAYEKNPTAYDLSFLDIETEGDNGMRIAARLRQAGSSIQIVFTTKVAQLAAMGYNVDALGYLIKPIEYPLFRLVMRKVQKLMKAQAGVTIRVAVDGGMRILQSRDVRYVEVDRHNLLFHTADATYRTRGSLKDISSQLAGEPFSLANRYALVNLAWVRGITDGQAELDTGELLPLSRSRRREFPQALAAYLGA